MTSVRRALVVSLLERHLLLVLALASNIVLARLLTPEQIGIYSVSLAVIGIAQVLRDFGIGNFLIQSDTLDDGHVRTAFGLSLIIGATLFAATALLAPLVAGFYGHPAMAVTLRLCALNFLVLPFCTISVALLRREMQFQRLLTVNLVAATLGFVVTLALALRGWGPDSMALGALATNAATGIGAWLLRAQRRMLWPSLSHWREMLHFGAHSSVTNVVTTISMDVNDLALGRILGLGPVALMSRAQGLAALFSRDLMAAVRNVALPAFAQQRRLEGNLEAAHVHSVAGVTAVGWPFFGFLALFPLEVMRLLYGPQWDPAAGLVLPLAAAGAVYACASLVSTVLTATGRVDLISRVELLFQPLRAASVVLAAIWFQSLMACALVLLAMQLLYVPMYYRAKQRVLATDWVAMRKALLRSAAATTMALSLPLALSLGVGWTRPQPMPLAWLLLAAAWTGLCWVLALQIVKHPLAADPIFQRMLGLLPWLRWRRADA